MIHKQSNNPHNTHIMSVLCAILKKYSCCNLLGSIQKHQGIYLTAYRKSELLPPEVPVLGDLPDPAHGIFPVNLLIFSD